MKVEVACTTDDPSDSLEHHQAIIQDGTVSTKVLPTFRPDKYILIENPNFSDFVQKLGSVANVEINSYTELLKALRSRADFFASLGGRLADHGLEQIYAADFTEEQANSIFQKGLTKQSISADEALIYKSAVLHALGVMYHQLNWTQQFHLGALRNNNSRALRTLGPDTGWDSIGDWSQAQGVSKFLGRLDENDQLAKTIIYNLNPRDNDLMATMIGNFNDGSIAGKVQFGAEYYPDAKVYGDFRGHPQAPRYIRNGPT